MTTYIPLRKPLDYRTNIENTSAEVNVLFFGLPIIVFLYGVQSFCILNGGESLFNLNLTADLMEEQILKIRAENELLEARVSELRRLA